MPHRLAGTPEWQSWHGMRQRCTDPKAENYPDYGGRGITCCERWAHFENFLSDMDARPAGMTLGRRDNDGPYSPDNCRWETLVEQNRNSRNCRVETLNGRTKIVTEWAEEFGVDRKKLFNLMRTRTMVDSLRRLGCQIPPGQA